jgi:hypothetical protein
VLQRIGTKLEEVSTQSDVWVEVSVLAVQIPAEHHRIVDDHRERSLDALPILKSANVTSSVNFDLRIFDGNRPTSFESEASALNALVDRPKQDPWFAGDGYSTLHVTFFRIKSSKYLSS